MQTETTTKKKKKEEEAEEKKMRKDTHTTEDEKEVEEEEEEEDDGSITVERRGIECRARVRIVICLDNDEMFCRKIYINKRNTLIS